MAMSRHNHLRALCEGAIMIAACALLNYLRIYRMPWGGSVDLAMLPIIVFSVRWGLARGLTVGAVCGVLQYFLGNAGSAVSWESILGDFLFAYMAVGLAGLFRRRSYGAVWGSLAGGGARFVVHFIVGATVWKKYMPDIFLGMKMSSPVVYSLLYNGCYMIPNIILAAVISWLLYFPLKKQLRGEDIV